MSKTTVVAWWARSSASASLIRIPWRAAALPFRAAFVGAGAAPGAVGLAAPRLAAQQPALKQHPEGAQQAQSEQGEEVVEHPPPLSRS
ncbi:MAG: hypothetical protein B0D88_09385 [Candidatus Sedimenticola endophacoides]|nr:MAG: hypothetical protein B0D88_09385 [Candidatus Sedimenticola endophacoides]